MSLINDALKRAKQVQPKSPPPLPVSPVQPVETARAQETERTILVPVALVFLALLGAGMIWFVVHSANVSKTEVTLVSAKTAAASDFTPASAPPVANLPPPEIRTSVNPLQQHNQATDLTVGTSENIAPVTDVEAASINEVPAAVPPSTAISNAPPPVPELPKLQGIVFRPERPAALINGKTVFIGSLVGEYRVVAVTQRTVTVVRAGHTNILEMPD